MNLRLRGRWCVHEQRGCNFTQEGIDDVIQNSTSAAAHLLLICAEVRSRDGNMGKETEKRTKKKSFQLQSFKYYFCSSEQLNK